MCGFAGIICSDRGQAPNRSLLSNMGQALNHRGPDQDGVFTATGVGLVHRRLSIIDLAHGRQPMRDREQRWTLVYNGEIYNFRAIRNELAALGVIFEEDSDTEVLLQAWRTWGADCLQKFNGMFAFAVWDAQTRTLHLVRDRLGIKPLYYGLTRNNDLIFGSELKALLVHPALSRDVDPCAVEEYLALGYVPDPRSILKNVHTVPPGHHVRCLPNGERQIDSYWDVAPDPERTGNQGALAEELRERLEAAVQARLVADVPLGGFLSGGLDSSTVIALMSDALPDAVRTCGIGFDEPAFDESPYSRQVAQHFVTDHDEAFVHATDDQMLARLAQIYDAPFADSSALPTYAVCELARRRVKVALSGDGGDEVFGGYRRYQWHWRESRVRGLLPPGVRRPLFATLGRLYPKADWAPRVLRARTTFQALARETVEAYFHTVSVIPGNVRSSLYSAQIRRELQGYSALELFRYHAERAGTDDPLRLAQYLDIKTWLPGDILTKVDRASMAHSLEVRVPLLDHSLVEWGVPLATNLKFNNGAGKYLLKKAMEDTLPREIVYRRKQGFSVPLKRWFKGGLVGPFENLLGESVLLDSGWFEKKALQRLWQQHRSGVGDHSTVLWSLLMLDRSLERLQTQPAFVGGDDSAIDACRV